MRFFVRTMIIAGIAAGVLGCQSGPHWPQKFAWWKHDTPPEDTSAIARSVAPATPASTVAKTAPALPSTQSAPEAMAAAGLEGATPPSATNLAATKAPVAAPLALAPAKPQAAIAPLAATAPPTAAMPAAGPYDPNAYRSTNAIATSPAASNNDLKPVPDRYGMTASAPPTAPVNSMPTAPPSASPAGDRYAVLPNQNVMASTIPPTVNTVAPPVASTAPPAILAAGSPAPASLGSPSAARATVGDRYGNPNPNSYAPMGAISESTPAPATAASPSAAAIPPAATSVAVSANGTTTISSTIQLTSAPGQYRPGGTSSYMTSPATSGQIEVATRPLPAAPPATAPPAMTSPQTGGSRY